MNKEKEIYVYADFLYHDCEPVGTMSVMMKRYLEYLPIHVLTGGGVF